MFTDYSGAKILIDGYKSIPPIDIHTNIAQLLNVERDPTAKRINFGLLNGMGVKKLAVSLFLSLQEAQRIHKKYDQMVPEAKGFLRLAETYARKRGWVRTKLGRRRHFPDWRIAHKAGNSIVQGTAADMTKLKMVEIDEFFERNGASSYLSLQVHDELDWFTAKGEEKVTAEARRIMTSFGPNDVIQFKVPMTLDSHQAPDWGRASFPDYKWQ